MSNNRMLRGAGTVGSLTMLSRLLGFVRDLLVASFLGAGIYADAFFVAFRIPNLLRSIFAEGALTSAFVPVFSDELAKGKTQAVSAMRSIASFMLLATSIVTLLGIIFSPQIIGFIAPGFISGSDKTELCIKLTQYMLPYIIFVSLIALVNSALNSVHVYGASALAQVVMNLTLIAGALLAKAYSPATGTDILALSVLAGGLMQLLAQIPAMRRAGFTLRPSAKILTPQTKQVLFLMTPAIVGACVYQLQMFLNTLFASLLPEGSVSYLYYADRLAQLPLGVFSIALASVLLPNLASAQSRDDKSAFATHLSNSIRYTSFIILPLSCLMYFFSVDLIQVLFERGKFTHQSTLMSAEALGAYCFGLWATSVQSMILRAFAARKDTITPTLLGILTLCLTLIFSLILIGPINAVDSLSTIVHTTQSYLPVLDEAHSLKHAGIALSSGLASLVSLLLAAVIFSNRCPDFSWQPFLASSVRSIISAAFMIAILNLFVPSIVAPSHKLLLGGAVGLITYFLSIQALKSTEAQETFSLISRLINRQR